MNIATVLLVFAIAWWLVFFVSLSVGVRAQTEDNEDIVKGTVPSAPSNPNLKMKVRYTTAIAAVLTVIYYFIATSGLISFRVPLS